MKDLVTLIGACIGIAFATAPSASALTAAQVKQCNAMNASIQARHGELQDFASTREELAANVEIAGEEWENAESVRNYGADKAALADEKKTAYDTLKAEFMRKDMAYQANVAQLNQDVAGFNNMCSPKG